ncbi:MAG: DUF262 domain-containing protein [Methanoregula sp.]|nr:DUF262 domain-containing protein [Methanoregula sp.]
MKKIDGKEKSLSDLLSFKKYTIHYYQREYRWGKKQIEELIEDLTGEFLDYYEPGHTRDMVSSYGHYFLGSIVVSSNDSENAIIDGQQRLTSLTLLLIYLNNLQVSRSDMISINHLIFSEKHGEKSFNIHVREEKDRESCLNALYTNKEFNTNGARESVKNIYGRYQDIVDLFPESLKENALPFFIDWLIYNVDLVEILAYTEQDAHKIFVSMNDRGLSLTPTEMLKGFLLSEIKSDAIRNNANEIWKKEILELNKIDKDEDANFLKNWLRAQYAETIRETKKKAEKEDWDNIGTQFHKWVRDKAKVIGLEKSPDYTKFVTEYFPKFADIYKQLKKYSVQFDPDYECVFYNANNNFTLQYQVILSAISPEDNNATIKQKIQIVSRYLDQYIARRAFNFKTLDYSSMKNPMFKLSKKIRQKSVPELLTILQNELKMMEFALDGIDCFFLNLYTVRYMRHILARITHYVEKGSGLTTKFEDYVNRQIRNPYDIEHIWADHYERFKNEFATEDEFKAVRNKFGDLLLLPQDKNRSFNDKEYIEKLSMYFGENLLAKSLHENCYKNNPQFLKFKQEEMLDFRPFPNFTKDSIEERQQLYKEICKKIWNVSIG